MEKKKALLKQYAENAREIARLEKALGFWEARCASEEARALAEVLNNKLTEASKTALLIERAVANLDDMRLRHVLTYHYIDGLTWEQTADMLRMEIRWVFRLHNRALEALNI